MDTVSIKGLDKAVVFAALYNRAKAQGMGFTKYDPEPMTAEQAQENIGQFGYFDYVLGRVMKIDLSGNDVSTGGYNRDNGQGAVEEVIAELRDGGAVNSPSIRNAHSKSTLAAAAHLAHNQDEQSSSEVDGNILKMHIGISDIWDDVKGTVNDLLEDSKDDATLD